MFSTAEMDAPTRMRVRLAITKIRQQAVAMRLGMPTDKVSKILTGVQAMPEDFEARFNEAVDALAEVAA